ncbi:MAG: thermonuclease family protein [Gammaproteobacteria bacterium]|nr:thermonuclease family protein [Gammaproteobacteria bacterium]
MIARVIVLFFLLFLSLAAFANTLTGKVVKITDGDTLYVLDANYKQHKIRLAGIDAPERKQAYGLASRKHLASIVTGKQVTIEYEKRDRYGRIVGESDGTGSGETISDVVPLHNISCHRVKPAMPRTIITIGMMTTSPARNTLPRAFHAEKP